MKIVSNELYNKIPLFDRLDKMPVKKLIKLARKKYGILYTWELGTNKFDLISDIISAETRDREKTIKLGGTVK